MIEVKKKKEKDCYIYAYEMLRHPLCFSLTKTYSSRFGYAVGVLDSLLLKFLM